MGGVLPFPVDHYIGLPLSTTLVSRHTYRTRALREGGGGRRWREGGGMGLKLSPMTITCPLNRVVRMYS